MSKRNRAAAKEATKPAEKNPAHLPGVMMLKPRKKLFVALLAVLMLWSAALLVMYFKTVYPHRKDDPKQPARAYAAVGANRE